MHERRVKYRPYIDDHLEDDLIRHAQLTHFAIETVGTLVIFLERMKPYCEYAFRPAYDYWAGYA